MKEIELPDGSIGEFPDEMDDNAIASVLRKQYGSQPAPVEPPKQSRKDSILARFGRGLADPSVAAAQLVGKGLTAINVPYGREITDTYKQMENQYQADRAASGETGTDWARIAGNVVSPTNLAAVGKIPMAGSLGQKVIGSAAAGEIAGALTPAYDDNFAKQKAGQIALGGIIGGALQPVASGLGRIISPKASMNPELQLLKSEGVQPTIGQALGGIVNALEEKLQSVPIMGDMISVARKRANKGVEQAAFNRALKPIGQKLPEGLSGNDAVAFTEQALRDKYDDVLGKIGAIKPDEKFNAKTLELKSMVDGLKMPDAEKQKFALALDDVMSSVDDNGVITSDAYKALESSLGSQASMLGRSQNIYEAKMAPAVKQLQQNLKEMLDRQAGDLSGELKNANAGWANFKRVQKAASSVGSESGQFTPAQLQAAVKATDKSKDKAAFARGNALMQDLSGAAKNVLGSKVPNSGTAERLMYGAGALGSGFVNPAIPVGLTAGAGAYTAPIQNALVKLATERPDLAPQIAERLNALAAPATAGFIPNRMGNQ